METSPQLALIRVDENLSFINIGVVKDFILAHLTQHRGVEHLVLLCSAVNHVDSSAPRPWSGFS